MLILQRKEGETIVIGGDVVLRVSRIRGNHVQITIDAPEEIGIVRGELLTSARPVVVAADCVLPTCS